ncbi:MAG: metal-dependent transcriptional regulator [Bacteroidales bacterium]|nr:metal-dependent transcriptional regulator [Bacteroidales bacterium]
MSISTENFIKTIYMLDTSEGKDSRPGSIASELGISYAATTDMARKLAEKDLIHYKKYQEIRLTREGRRMALDILRKHRLWELFLHQTFGLSMQDIHREAEMLEHQTSDFLAEKLSDFLGNPMFDPHGDPIPDKDGNIITDPGRILLAAAVPGETYMISRIYSSSREILEFCEMNGLLVGTGITIVGQFQSPQMTEILLHEQKLILSREFTQVIYLT